LNVALVNPTSKEGESVIRTGRCQIKCLPGIGIYPPIDLAHIAAYLRNDLRISVFIYDAAVTGSYSQLLNEMSEYNPEIIIMNCTTPTLYNDLELSIDLKQSLPQTHIIVFGLHASVNPSDIFIFDSRRTGVDYILLNEFEVTALELCQKILNDEPLENIPGVAYIDSADVVHRNLREAIKTLDELGLPARDLIDNNFYRLQYNNEPYTIIQTSRGCFNSCTYCTATIGNNKKVVYRSVPSIIAEIKEIKEQYHLNNVMFLSDTFTASKKWVIELCNEIIKKNIKIKWMANSRVDTIDFETALLMKKAGCWIVSLGIESANNDILKNVKKNTTEEQITTAIKIFKKAKIKMIGYFMFGLPGETKQTIKNTIKFARKSDVDFGYFYIATPYPGTEFYNLVVENGWLKSKEWNRYFNGDSDVIDYPDLTVDELKKAVRSAYFNFYFNVKRIFKRIIEIRSFYLVRKYVEISIAIIKKIFK
jgi:Fe-S oxidoreductase